MSELLKRAFEAASRLPESRQRDIAGYLIALCEAEDVPLSAEEAAAIAEAEAQIARGEFASLEAVEAFWKRHK